MKIALRTVPAATTLFFSAFFVFMLTFFSSSHAGPACPDQTTIEQPDGTVIGAFIHGDEFQPWITTSDGYTIVRDTTTGYWEYALRNANSTLAPSGARVTPAGTPPARLEKNLMPPRDTERERTFNEHLQQGQRKQLGTAKLATVWTPRPLSGTRKLLVVRVTFAGDSAQALNPAITRDDWDTIIFTGPKSVTQYYHDNSHGLISVTGVTHTQSTVAGIIDVTVNLSHPWYAYRTSDPEYITEITWIGAALREITDNHLLDIASYDTNQDGTITGDELNIHLITAGYEAAGSTKTPSVWAHSWSSQPAWTGLPSLTAGSPAKIIAEWSISGEMNDNGKISPMGPITHELGHLMCFLPDLYDVTYSNGGLGHFSLMSGGSWGADTRESAGTTPVALDAWSRQYLGWTTPREALTDGQTLTFPGALNATDSPVKLWRPLSYTEYFLAENRFPTGWDCGFRRWFGDSWGGGLLILHCDTDVGSGSLAAGNDINNYQYTVVLPNSWGHQGVMAEEADTTKAPSIVRTPPTRGHWTTLYYHGNVDSFTTVTTPNSNYYNGVVNGIGLIDISAPGNPMTATSTFSRFLCLTTPNGDDEWKPGTVHDITWTGSRVTTVKIECSTDSGATWTEIVASVPASAGSFAWTVPNALSEYCLVRITDAADTSLWDTSNGLFTITAITPVCLADTPWPMRGQNPQHTGRGVATLSASSTLKWRFKTGTYATSSLAIGADGTVYVGADESYLYAINPDGTLKWTFRMENYSVSTPAIGSDGRIYVCSDTYLYAIRADGTLKWKFKSQLGGMQYSSPVIGTDGTVYMGSLNYFYAITPQGKLKWKRETGWTDHSSPAIDTDGTIYDASTDSCVYAMSPDGTVKWRLMTSEYLFSSPAIGNDGTIYVRSEYHLYAIHPDGTLKWIAEMEYPDKSPAIGADGTVYVGEFRQNLSAIHPDGTLKWKFNNGLDIMSAPAVGNDGTLYLGLSDAYGYVVAIRPDGTEKWRYNTGYCDISNLPAIGADGTLYAVNYDGYLYAFASDSTITSVSSPTPSVFAVSPPYPNPFNPSTAISLQIPQTSPVRVVMYNVLGQEVRVLHDGLMAPGSHTLVWDGRNTTGGMSASGVYFYTVKAGANVAKGKVMFLR